MIKKLFLIAILFVLIILPGIASATAWDDGSLQGTCYIWSHPSNGAIAGMVVYDKLPYENGAAAYITIQCPVINGTGYDNYEFWNDDLDSVDAFITATQFKFVNNELGNAGLIYNGNLSARMVVDGEDGTYYPSSKTYAHLGDYLGGTSPWSFMPKASWELVSLADFLAYNPVSLIFSVSKTGEFETKLQGVNISISEGTSGTTDANGILEVFLDSGSYNYEASKPGYSSVFSALGGYGEVGGTLYLTMSPYTGGVPAGYTQTTVHAIDGVTGNHIPGSTINTKCVTNETWKNETTSNGISYVTCPSADTIDIYGSLPGTYTASLELGAVQGGDYYLPLYPPVPEAPIGFINLFVYLREAGTGFIIKNAAVTIRLPSGATSGQNTGTSGTAQFTVPNQTVIIISSNPAGYNGQSISKTMGTVDYQVTITLSRATTPTGVITPVTTDPITGDVITTAATLDIRTDREKDTDMFGQIRIAGPGLIDLGIVAIVFGLLGFITKGVSK